MPTPVSTLACEAGATTVLLPTYQRARLLRRCLESVRPTLGQRDRVLVVNDGSTDETVAVVRDFGSQVTLFEQPNAGRAAALNAGLALVQTEYCWTFDDDDVVLPGAIHRLASFMNSQPALGFCVTTWVRSVSTADSNAPEQTGNVSRIPSLTERGRLVPLFEANYVGGAALFARTQMLQALGGFDRRFIRSPDYHLAIRAVLAYSFASVPGGPTFLYAHHHERGVASARFPADQQRRKWLKFDQWIYFDLIAALPDAHFEEPGAPALHRTPVALTNRARAAATKLLLDQTIDALLTRVVRCSEVMPSAHEQGLIAAIPTLGQ